MPRICRDEGCSSHRSTETDVGMTMARAITVQEMDNLPLRDTSKKATTAMKKLSPAKMARAITFGGKIRGEITTVYTRLRIAPPVNIEVYTARELEPQR